MNRNEAERLLRSAGFEKDERSKHVVWKFGDVIVTMHRGNHTTDRLKHQVRQAIRRANMSCGLGDRITPPMIEPTSYIAAVPVEEDLMTNQCPVEETAQEETPVAPKTWKVGQRIYSDDDLAVIKKLFEEGKTDEQIAVVMKNRHPEITAKLVAYARSYHLNLKRRNIVRKSSMKGKTYTDEQLNSIRIWIDEGKTDKQIAKAIQDSRPGTTFIAIKKLRLKLMKDATPPPAPPKVQSQPVTKKNLTVAIMEGDTIKARYTVTQDNAKVIVDLIMGW